MAEKMVKQRPIRAKTYEEMLNEAGDLRPKRAETKPNDPVKPVEKKPSMIDDFFKRSKAARERMKKKGGK